MKNLKTFKDLKFKAHLAGNGKQAVLMFPNGFGVSVVRFKTEFGYGSYTSNESEWELAVLTGDGKSNKLTYNTPITDDVLGHLTNSDVTNVMKKVQQLKLK